MVRERIKKEGSLLPWIAAGVVLSVCMGLGAYLFFRGAGPATEETGPGFAPISSIAGPKISVTLMFPSRQDGYLRPEARDVRMLSDTAAQVREVVEELIRGPELPLVPSFPAETRVKSVFIDDTGTAYVNFSRELQANFPGGAWTETLTIYSLTNTLTMNFDEINQVQILVEGVAVPTLAGHIDTATPFKPRPALNRE